MPGAAGTAPVRGHEIDRGVCEDVAVSTEQRRRRASISDVAKMAGVAVGTVSNVLNRPEIVAPATRERVQAAIAELSFVPNGVARQLRAGTITTVGAILLDVRNPFFTEVARGVEGRLTLDNHTLMLALRRSGGRSATRSLQGWDCGPLSREWMVFTCPTRSSQSSVAGIARVPQTRST